jgi:predicted transcriptional regulator
MKRITIALQDDVHERLKDAAEREHRSLTAQMRVYIERGLANDQNTTGLIAALKKEIAK